tara:strand:- start:2 stop:280 length:279 start_codon:yes stop_codon:yes gene_type:complete
MANTDAQHLEELKLTRDKLISDLKTNGASLEIEIRGKKYKRSDVMRELSALDKEIALYADLVASASTSEKYGRNFVRIARDVGYQQDNDRVK